MTICMMEKVNHSPKPQGSRNSAEQMRSRANGALAQPRPKATSPSCGKWSSGSCSSWKMANLYFCPGWSCDKGCSGSLLVTCSCCPRYFLVYLRAVKPYSSSVSCMTMGTATAMAARTNPKRTVRSRLLQQQQQPLLQHVLMVPPALSKGDLDLTFSKTEEPPC